MVIQCELCPANAQSSEELFTHYSSHFTNNRCGNCHKQLILVDGQFYVLHLHNQLNCNPNSFDDNYESGFGDIKTEIDELGSELFRDSYEIIQDASSLTKERKSNDESNEICIEYNNADDTENDATNSRVILPFEVVECDAIKTENELFNNAGGHSILNTVNSRLSAEIVVKKIVRKRPARKLPYKLASKDFQCNICEKYFRGKQELTGHKRWHFRIIDKNDIKLAKVNIDEKEIESMSSDQVLIKPFQCKHCQKYLMSEHTLREHIKRIHLFAYSEKNLSEEECSRIPIEKIHTKVTGEKCLKSFQCEICNKYFLRRDSLNKHKELHNQLIDKKEMKKIPFDQISVKPSGEMYVRKHKCTVCAKYFLTKTSLCSHMHSHKRATVQSESSSAGAATLDLDAAPPERIFVQPSGEKQLREKKCETCGKYFLSKHSLTEHIKRAHLLEHKKPLLTDEECKQLPTAQILTTKTGERYLKKFKCDICCKYLMTEQILAGHLKLHKERANQTLTEGERNKLPNDRLFVKPSGEVYLRKFKCAICDKYFLTQGVLNSHMKTHKRRTYESQSALKEEMPAERIHVNANGVSQLREVQCQICGKYLLSKHTLGEHIKYVHQSIKKNPETPQILTEEESRSLLPQQVLTASNGIKYLRKYMCDICNKYILTKQSILYHMKSYHYPKPPEAQEDHICDICGKVLKKKWSLKVHKLTHSDAKRFVCNYCGRAFRTKNQMEEHTNSHTGLKPFKCTVCGNAFGKRSLLNAHRRIHTGEKPYKCSIEGCERAYTYSSDLNRHLYGAHGIYTKKFECTICSRIFPENKLLTKHMKSHV